MQLREWQTPHAQLEALPCDSPANNHSQNIMSFGSVVVFVTISLSNSEMASPASDDPALTAPDDPAAAKEAQAPLPRLDEWSPRERAQEQQGPNVHLSAAMLLPWLVALIAGALGVFLLRPGRKAMSGAATRRLPMSSSVDDWPARKAAAKSKASVEALEARKQSCRRRPRNCRGFAGAAFSAWAVRPPRRGPGRGGDREAAGLLRGRGIHRMGQAVADEKAEAEEKARVEAAAAAKRAADEEPLKEDEGLKNVGKAFTAMGDGTKDFLPRCRGRPRRTR